MWMRLAVWALVLAASVLAWVALFWALIEVLTH